MSIKSIFNQKLTNKTYSEWEIFIKNHGDSNIFQSPYMYEIFFYTKNYSPIAILHYNKKKIIDGVLLGVIQKEKGILSLFSSRCIVFGGPLINNNSVKILEEIIKAFNNEVKNRAIYSQIRNFIILKDNFKSTLKDFGYKYEEHLNIIVDVLPSVEDLWKGIKRNRKDGINKGKKQGFEFNVYDSLDSLDEFYFLLEELYSKIKLPYPTKSLFTNLNRLNPKHIKWFELKYNNEPRIILCALIFNKTLYAFYIGISQDAVFTKLRPVDWFYWKVISWAAENNFKYFDWMGAGKPKEDSGVREFKLQYGGELIEFGRFEKVHSKILFKIGFFGLKIWRRIKI